MVVFCCNACGESLKKNQVEKHWQTVCRGNCHVSCMDCQKDFVGSEYQAHTKCISEEQKYSAPGFVAKVNKGEVKQDLWIQQVHSAIKKSLNNPRLKDLLQRLLDFPNIPRKKQKFENFLSNSMRVRDKNLVSQVWDVLMSEKAEKKEEETQAKPEGAAVESNGDSTKPKETKDPEVEVKEEEEEATEKKLSKRERKEARRNKQNKVEKKEKKAVAQAVQEEASDNEEERQKKKKKSKKRKRDEEADSEKVEGVNTDNGETQDVSEKKKKKKKKHKEMAEENGVASEEGSPTADLEKACNGDAGKAGKKKKKKDRSAENGSNSEQTEALETSMADISANGGENDEDGKADDEDALQNSTSKLHRKVRVDDLIVRILQSKGELPVKKLKKKVLQELTAQGAMSKSREAVWAKVEKKVSKNPRYKLHKDRVSLVH